MIRIAGIDIEVVEVSNLDIDGDYGRWVPMLSRIEIAAEISPAQKKATLRHEFLEAVNDIHKIGLKHEHIQRLEVALCDYLNP